MVDLTALGADDLPLALADVHRERVVGERVHVTLDGALARGSARDLLEGAGFAATGLRRSHGHWRATLERRRELPDVVGPGMQLLLVGLNPSLYAADAGVGFARPGNRFWPAVHAAGLDSVDRDPRQLLRRYRVGMTDLVKRATVGAAELSVTEYRDGLARLERGCRRLAPAAVCFLGLDGWRKAVDRRATAGWQVPLIGGSPAYVMPNPSGLNAHATVAGLAEHLRQALQGPHRE